jgi:proline iminopeptidase
MAYPSTEPYETGLLDVGDGNRVWWATSGNPNGKPAVVVHGGPGSGSSPNAPRGFDPQRYRVVQFDQRGCGRSEPHAADISTDLSTNTTRHLVADMEGLRNHLGIERWLVYGGSWGSTLSLAYAEQHPDRVSEIVLIAVTTGRHDETDWLYHGVRRFFPEAWERFRDAAGPIEDDEHLPAAYARLMGSPDAAVRRRAAHDWCAWEDAVLSAETYGTPDMYSNRPERELLAMVRLCTHYFSHGCFLPDNTIFDHIDRLAGIPGVLLHGRMDLSGPARNPWELHRAWPGSRLTLFSGAGHKGDDAMRDALLRTFDEFAGD